MNMLKNKLNEILNKLKIEKMNRLQENKLRSLIRKELKRNPKLLKEALGGVVSLKPVNQLNSRYDETEEEYDLRNRKQRRTKLKRKSHRLTEKRVDRFSQLDILIEYLDESGTLDAIVRAMSDDDFNDIFEYIARMNDIDY